MTGAVDAAAGCTVVGSRPRRVCGRVVVMRATVGCVHEHLEDVAVCQFHVEELADGDPYCVLCDDLGHECSVTLLAEIDEDGRRTVLRG